MRVLGTRGATPDARIDAVAVLANVKTDADRAKALAALAPVIEDPSPDVRVSVARALGRLADDRALPALSKHLAVERDAGALAASILAVGSIGARSAVSGVLPFADHALPRVRAAAATALGDLGGEPARARLLALLAQPGDDGDWTVRAAVLLGLSKCGKPEDSGVVLVAYRDGGGAASWFARAALARAVAALDSDPVPILDRLMADDDARVSSAAGLALVRAGRADEVVKRLSDPREGVRASAVAAVADGELRTAIPRLKEIALGDRVRAVRWSAALALSRLDDPFSDSLLVEGLSSEDPAVWTSALDACLAKNGGAGPARDPDAWKKVLAERRARLSR